MTQNRYSQTGVDIDAGKRTVDLIKLAVQSTYSAEVLSDTSSFGGLYDVSSLKEMDRPVLVASTDGVGTKTIVAAKMNQWDGIGQDIVNHCINDILVQGAKPLFFLDYLASSKLNPEQIAGIVSNMAEACKAANCALLAGETAEMPGVYHEGAVDIAGTIVGVLEHSRLITGSTIEAGDVILALPSTGLHTNGYSLARSVLAELDWKEIHPDLGLSIGETLLIPHRCYLSEIEDLWAADIEIRGLAHLTGGGIIENLPRILPEGLGAVINYGSWPVLPIFKLIQNSGAIEDSEMFRVFNMGMGMLIILPKEQVQKAQAILAESYIVGEIVSGQSGVKIEGERKG